MRFLFGAGCAAHDVFNVQGFCMVLPMILPQNWSFNMFLFNFADWTRKRHLHWGLWRFCEKEPEFIRLKGMTATSFHKSTMFLKMVTTRMANEWAATSSNCKSCPENFLLRWHAIGSWEHATYRWAEEAEASRKAMPCDTEKEATVKWVCLKIVYPWTQWLMIIIPIKWL